METVSYSKRFSDFPNVRGGELLENFQWKTSEEAVQANFENIKDELADVVIYALLLSHE